MSIHIPGARVNILAGIRHFFLSGILAKPYFFLVGHSVDDDLDDGDYVVGDTENDTNGKPRPVFPELELLQC